MFEQAKNIRWGSIAWIEKKFKTQHRKSMYEMILTKKKRI